MEEWRLHLVIPYFATHPGTCLLRESGTENESGSAGGAARRSNDAPPVLALYEWSEGPRPADSELDDIPLVITVHEYCHANQYWHMQRSSRYESQLDVWEKFPRIRAAAHSNAMWWAVATPAGRAFVEAVGMRWSDTGGWAVSSFPFNVMYRRHPLELAAEVCTEYYSKILEIDSRYAWATWDLSLDDGQANPWLNRLERYDWDPGAVLTPRVVQWLNDWVLLPHVDTGLGQRPTDLGQCEDDMRVGLGQSCWVPNAPARFVVPDDANGYAWSPCDQHDVPGNLNEARIKVDVEQPGACGNLPKGWTFQAERVGDAWYVRVVGQWKNAGECASGQEVSPGEYCTVSLWRTGPGDLTPVQFRVYAVDELVPSDRLPGSERALHSAGGYAILYYWPDGEQPHADNGRLHYGKVRHPANGVALFEATKLRHRGKWEIDSVPSGR